MAFTKGSVVLKAAEIANDDLGKLSAVKGEIAGKLGKLLVAEYHADKVALLFSAVEKLKDNKKLSGKTKLTYTVEVDDKGKKLEFCVQSAKKELVRVTLLDGLDKLDKGGTVVNLDPKDDTIRDSSQMHATKLNKDSGEFSYDDEKLKGLNTKKKIVLVGHGIGPDVSGDQTYTANDFGGKSSDEIVKFLIKKGLSPKYNGTIYLAGCHTAAGSNNPKSFAANVHATFAAKGYKLLSVAGTPGTAVTTDAGGENSTPAELRKTLEKTITQTKKLLNTLEEALKKGKEDQARTEAQVKALEDQYVGMRALILEMPPEAHKTLEDKLMTPLKKSRDELVPALKEMLQSNKTLEGAVKSEQTYLKKLEDGMKDKSDYLAKKITYREFTQASRDRFSVEEWWGTFGPAKATSVKVKKDSEKIGGLFAQFKAKFTKAKVKA